MKKIYVYILLLSILINIFLLGYLYFSTNSISKSDIWSDNQTHNSDIHNNQIIFEKDDIALIQFIDEQTKKLENKNLIYEIWWEIENKIYISNISPTFFQAHFSKSENYQNIIIPSKNIFCLLGKEQMNFNFKLYDIYRSWNIKQSLDIFWDYSEYVEKYLNNEKIVWTDTNDVLRESLNNLIDSEKDLIELYNKNDIFNFRKKMYEITKYQMNEDAIIIVFFYKHQLTNSIDWFLNSCYSYSEKNINTQIIQDFFYKK